MKTKRLFASVLAVSALLCVVAFSSCDLETESSGNTSGTSSSQTFTPANPDDIGSVENEASGLSIPSEVDPNNRC